MQTKLMVGQVLNLQVKRMGINGEGIAYYHNLAIFVDGVIPGEEADVRIDKVFTGRAEGSLVKLTKVSTDRLEVKYPDYALCGAYDMQHMTYEAALKFKKQLMIQAFNRYIKGFNEYKKIKDIIGMKEPLGYRNKVSLPVRKLQGKNKFGLYAKNSNEFIPVIDTPVHDPKINEILKVLEKMMDQFKFDAYIQRERSGYLKSVVIRRTTNQKEVQVSFLLMKKYPKLGEFVDQLVEQFEEIKSVYVYYSKDYKEQVFFTKHYELVYGKETIEEHLNDFVFELYPESFFQLNTVQADLFYQKMFEYAKLKPSQIAIDAYAGIAPVSHYISSKAKLVYAIELDKKSVESAKQSLVRNKIENVVVIQKDFQQSLRELEEKVIDVMIFNPPRTGLGEATIEEILKYKPKRIVYGSCNPSTLAKDLSVLLKHYELGEVLPFDMFPFTPLVESVSLLKFK